MTDHTNATQKNMQASLKPLNPLNSKKVIAGALFATVLASSGCATSSLLDNSGHVTTNTTKQILSEDQIVAFGRPAHALPKMPNASMVIVGEKNSYVLTQGGIEMVNLLSNLSQKNIQVDMT